MGPFYALRNTLRARGRRHALSIAKGFTVIEMLIVMIIIAIITVVVITSQGAFNKSLILSNAAYDVALAIRSAQSYGIGSRLSVGGNINVGYGLHFTAGPNVSSFKVFTDSFPSTAQAVNCHGLPPGGASAPDAKIGDCAYSLADQPTTTYTLNRGVTISKICATDASGTRCSTNNAISFMSVVFVRPSPAPFISLNGSYNATVTRACLTLTSPQGGARSVAINASGQIQAATSCP